MRMLVFLIVTLTVAIIGGALVYEDPGYMLLAFKGWTLEMPLWLGVMAVVLSMIALYFLVGSLMYLLHGTGWFRRYLAKRKVRSARKLTTRGLIELAEGNWRKAEKLLFSGASGSETPLINYLSAAKAAQERGDNDKRDHYLRLAHEATMDSEVAIGLTQAQLQYKASQYEQCLATLKRLQQLAPKHPFVLKLLYRVYLSLNDWEQLQTLLPELRRLKSPLGEDVDALEKTLYEALLNQAMSAQDLQRLNELWGNAPKSVQTDTRLVGLYCAHLQKLGQADEAEYTIRHAVKKQWDDGLVRQYGLLNATNVDKQMSVAESWLKAHSQNPTVLLTLGRICLRKQLWGQAKNYFEASIKLDDTPEAHCELGRILEYLGESESGGHHYRLGLMRSEKILALELPGGGAGSAPETA